LSTSRTTPINPPIPTPKATPGTGSFPTPVLPQRLFGSVGWADGPQRTSDGGLHWQYVTPPTPANVAEGGNTSFFLDANHAWTTIATGAAALQNTVKQNATGLLIFGTSDGGRTWSQGSIPISGFVNESARLFFIDARRGWVVTDSGQLAIDKSNAPLSPQPITRTIYATTDGGHNWSLLVSGREGDGSTLGAQALGCSMSGLTFTTVDRGWLTWDCFHSGPPPGQQQPAGSMVAATRDGGRSWQTVVLPSVPTTSDYACGAFPPVFTLTQGVLPVACGGIGHAGFDAVYATTDAGLTWTFRKLPSFGIPVFVDANRGWEFGGTTGLDLYRTTDGGKTWTVVSRFSSEKVLNSFTFPNSNTGFVLTSRYAADGTSGTSTVWKTTDGGQTWSVVSTVPNQGSRCC
jgi:photosystem II stability/assembly factor-like uncharacterized protein